MFLDSIVASLTRFSDILHSIFFYDIWPFEGEFPLLIGILFVACIFFSFYLNFINIRYFRLVFSSMFNSNLQESQETTGQKNTISSRAAFFTGVAAAVGLGGISGVAVAVKTGGPGAVFWIFVSGFLSMPLRYAEVFLGHKYRKMDETGAITEYGPFAYIKNGLAELGLPRLGKVLVVFFAAMFTFASFGGPSSFQINQTVAIMSNSFFHDSITSKIILSILVTGGIGYVALGGITRIAKVSQKLVILKSVIFLSALLLTVLLTISKIPLAIGLIVESALSFKAGLGGFLGALVAGFTRSVVASEAGLGSVPIVHAKTNNKSSVLEGIFSMSGPIFSNVIFCFLNGLILVATSAYLMEGEGIIAVKYAFDTAFPGLSLSLLPITFLCAITTVISWYYYGESAFAFLSKGRFLWAFKFLFFAICFIGGIINFDVMVRFLDIGLFSVVIPHILAIFLLARVIKSDLRKYEKDKKRS